MNENFYRVNELVAYLNYNFTSVWVLPTQIASGKNSFSAFVMQKSFKNVKKVTILMQNLSINGFFKFAPELLFFMRNLQCKSCSCVRCYCVEAAKQSETK